jgi:hypothetical protein
MQCSNQAFENSSFITAAFVMTASCLMVLGGNRSSFVILKINIMVQDETIWFVILRLAKVKKR